MIQECIQSDTTSYFHLIIYNKRAGNGRKKGGGRAENVKKREAVQLELRGNSA